MSTILITGGSGFLSVHCVALALKQGYQVRTTIRNDKKKDIILGALKQAGVDTSKLEFFTADLLKDDGWTEAAKGAEFVLHVASPFPGEQPKHEDELIRPAVDGTLRVLKAAQAAGVKRVVVTSSVAAVAYGTAHKGQYSEADWSDPEGKGSPISPYPKSKTLAEKAAWDFVESNGHKIELATVNPVGIFGPPLITPTESTTVGVIKQMLQGALPAVPNIAFGIVDVRDVAELHMLAATKPEAKGKRFIAVAGPSASLAEMSQMLKKGLGEKAKKSPTRVLPDFLVKFLGLFMAQLKLVASELGQVKNFDNSQAKSLGWQPRSNEEAIVSCGQALIDAKQV